MTARETAERNLRLFIAVELPDDVKRSLEEAIAALKREGIGRGLRWVRPEGVHLTLKFLGSTRPDRVAQIVSGLRSATVGTPSFELRPEGFGAFHGGKKAATFRTWRESYAHNVRVIFVGVEGATDELGALVSRIDEALEPLGIEKESRPYFAHLTLARVREDADRATREGISSVLSRFQRHLTRDGTLDPPQVACSFPTFTVPGVSLMESTLQPGGAVYRALETIPLRG